MKEGAIDYLKRSVGGVAPLAIAWASGLLAAALIVVTLFAGPSTLAADDTKPAPIILVIYGSFTGFSPHDHFHERLAAAVDREARQRVEVRAEFFDASAEQTDEYDALVLDYLQRKYPRDRVAVVVGVGARPIELATKIRSALFPSAGLVYGLADRRRMADFDHGANATGVSGEVDIGGTVALALQLLPDTRHIVVVVGSTEIERAWYGRVVEDSRAAAPGVELVELFGLPKDEMLGKLASLPDRTVVLWVSYFGQPDDLSIPADVLIEALDASNAPIFGLFDGDFGRGIVGGRIVDIGRQGEETGVLAARVANGEPAGTIPPVHVADNPAAVDWRALQRWKIDPRRLPPDAVVSFRAPTVWDEYGRYIVGVGAVLLVQTLLIAGLIVQRSHRMRAQKALADRLRFERVIADLSARFVDLPVEQIDSALDEGIEEIRAVYEADRVSLVEFSQYPARPTVVHSAVADGIEPPLHELEAEDIRGLVEYVRRGESLQYSRLEEIPSDLTDIREESRRRGIQSGIVVPLHAAGATFGWLSLAALREPRTWPADATARLRTLADIFANALVRKRGAAELHRSEELSGAVLKSITAQVCVLGGGGRILATNDAWRLASSDPGGQLWCLFAGARCPKESGSPATCAAVEAGPMRDRIRAVLDGSQSTFATEYHSATPTSDAWFSLTVERLRTPEGGAVLSHQNVTPRKRAELEAEQRRQELAHVARVSTMGELAASIAHELKQPLTGALTNAQAAVRFLKPNPRNVVEVDEILHDIIDDIRRADEVIRRLRSMLQKGAIEQVEIDLRGVVAEVLKLVATDAALRRVTVDSAESGHIPRVRADRIQLQQVVLNLVVNAMDAMKDVDPSERRVTIQTMCPDPETVLVSVSDRGSGIDQDKLGRIFQPFFTTKPTGMGMGLSIARTIIEAHGGVLWATNNADRGASFFFRLPRARAAAAAD